jgi:O-antigen ligase
MLRCEMAMAEAPSLKIQRWIIVAIALLAPMLTGGTQRWSQGVVLVLLGAAILLQPPQLFIGKPFAAMASAALAICAVAWLPATLFGETWWRHILVEELGMALPRTFSVQPWLSAEAFILLIAGLLWLLLLGGREWSSSDRRWVARRVCAGLIVLTIAWLVVHSASWHVPIWVCERNFGPFPNRNQTGDLLAIWSVIAAACAAEDFRRGRRSGFYWLVGVAVFLWGLIVNYSRAGVLLFFVGVIGWGTFQLLRARSMRYVAIGSATVLVAFSIFLIFGGSTLERFTASRSFLPDPMQDYRALVFRDAWHMAVKSPWCGVGLGNFEGMFTLAREASANHVRLLHPESDWLWLLDETGWLGPLLALGVAAIFVRRTFPLERKSAPTLRSAALVGAVLFALHGLFDVSGHRLGSAIPALMLFGLAARPSWTAAPSAIQAWIARGGAALIGVIGFAWIAATVVGWAWPGAIGVRQLRVQAKAANEAEQFADTLRATERAINLAPLDWENHYLRGVAHLFLEQPDEAQRDFRRSRRLEPSIASAPFEEGRMWIYFDAPRAKQAWAEALRREPEKNAEYFRKMVAGVGNHSDLRKMLRELAGDRTDLLLDWLANSSPEEFRMEIERLKTDAHFVDWTPAQLARLFDAWLKSGDRAELIQEIEAKPAWLSAGWKQLAAAYALQMDFQRACETVHRSQPCAGAARFT